MDDVSISPDKYSFTIRHTPVLLVLKILAAELLIALVSFGVRLVLIYLDLNIAFFSFLSLYSIIIFLLQLLNIYLILFNVFWWVGEYYILNPKEVIMKRGIANTISVTYELANLQSMTIEQSFVERILGYGHIHLFNPVLKEEVILSSIQNPQKYADIIQQTTPDSLSFIGRRPR